MVSKPWTPSARAENSAAARVPGMAGSLSSHIDLWMFPCAPASPQIDTVQHRLAG